MDLVRGVELAKLIRLVYLHVVVNKFDVHGVEGASVPAYPVVYILADFVGCSEGFIFCKAGIG